MHRVHFESADRPGASAPVDPRRGPSPPGKCGGRHARVSRGVEKALPMRAMRVQRHPGAEDPGGSSQNARPALPAVGDRTGGEERRSGTPSDAPVGDLHPRRSSSDLGMSPVRIPGTGVPGSGPGPGQRPPYPALAGHPWSGDRIARGSHPSNMVSNTARSFEGSWRMQSSLCMGRGWSGGSSMRSATTGNAPRR
jgi:hypothetical protein